MNSTVVNFPHTDTAPHQAEAVELRRMLEDRDALIRQTVTELVRVNQQNRQLQMSLDQAQRPATTSQDEDQLMALRSQNQYLEDNVRRLEGQVKAARDEVNERESGLRALLGKIQDLSENNRQLEKHLNDVPELYRRKFTERLNPVTACIENIQTENRRLQGEVQGMAQKLLAVQEAIAQPLRMLMSPAETPVEATFAALAPASLVDDVLAAIADEPPPVLRR